MYSHSADPFWWLSLVFFFTLPPRGFQLLCSAASPPFSLPLERDTLPAIVLLVIAVALSVTVIVLLNRPTTFVSQNIPPTVTPPTTPTPTPSPTPQSRIGTINLQLICQHCEKPGVVAFIKSYSIDPTGSTSLTVTFTNHTNSAVDMKVDTIKLLDQNGTLTPILSSDPYVGVSVEQTIPTIINFHLTPQPGTKYTFSIVMEEADVFTNFYQSPAFSLS